jgi:acyl-coenzyme A synthetase/AMP-(fatty) acid ligase
MCYLRTTNPGTRAMLLPLDHQIQIVRDTEAVTIYADAEGSERATELAEASGIPVTRPSPEAGRVDIADVVSWYPDAPPFIGYTSGSTGRPKGIRLARHAWEATVRAWMDLGSEAQVRTGNAPRNVATFRNLSINTIRYAGRANIAYTRRDLHDRANVFAVYASRKSVLNRTNTNYDGAVRGPRAGLFVAFPSATIHAVSPTTRGNRSALVAWLH